MNKSYFIFFEPEESKNMTSQLVYADAIGRGKEKKKTKLFIAPPRVEYFGRIQGRAMRERIKREDNIIDEITKASFLGFLGPERGFSSLIEI